MPATAFTEIGTYPQVVIFSFLNSKSFLTNSKETHLSDPHAPSSQDEDPSCIPKITPKIPKMPFDFTSFYNPQAATEKHMTF